MPDQAAPRCRARDHSQDCPNGQAQRACPRTSAAVRARASVRRAGRVHALYAAPMIRPALFIDDGGVMNENARRGRQWQRLVGEYFSPRLGGAPEAWAAANAQVVHRLFAEYETHFDADPGASFLKYWATYQEAWLSGMCTAVRVALPADRAAWSRLCRECEAFVTRRVRAANPGVIQAVRRLHAIGYVLRTASGERSWELEGYLAGMGVRECFVDLYGVDLVDTAKASRLFYAG